MIPKENRKEEVNYDTLLSSAGELGRYQLLLLFSTFPFYLFGVIVYFQQIFITEVPSKHWCWTPELGNLTEIERRNLSIPKDDSARFGYSQCQVYDANWTDVLLNGMQPNETWKTVKCQKGWEFDRTEFPYQTISTELGWVCDKSSYPATAQMVFFLGSVIGGILIGWMADRFGRISAVVASNVLGCIGGVGSVFVTNFAQFSICRFIMGLAHDNCMMMGYLISLEYLAPKYRSVLCNTAFAVFYSIFATALPFIALACDNWKTFTLVTSILLAIAVLTPVVIPESPRWLLSNGRADEAIDKIRVISRINRKNVSQKLIDQFKESVCKDEKEERVSSFEMLKRPLLRNMLILVCLDFMCCQVVFDGLLRNLEQLEFDFFYSFAASSLTEFPSVLLCGFVMDYFGRRWMATMMLSVNCVFCVLVVFVGSGIPSVVCVVVARFAVNMACNTVIQWSAEMLPSQVRGSGVALVHICANIATMISPYIAYLKVYVYWLPYVILATVAATGAFISLLLPETAKKEMPQTFDDAETMVRTQKFWEMPCLKRNREMQQPGHVNQSFEM